MKMTVREFIELWADGTHEDIDVYDNVCEELGIAYVGGETLTKCGEKHFAEVLGYEIDVIEPRTRYEYPVAIVDIDGDDWKHKLKVAKDFFYSAAGYCKDSDYRKWFREV